MTEQLDLLAAVAENPHPLAERSRARIRQAIRDAAAASGGYVCANRVRVRLINPATGRLDVPPRMLSATFGALAATGILAFDHWDENDDTAGRNRGKPQRVWRLVGAL